MSSLWIWIVSALTIFGVLARPFGFSEWVYASFGAVVLAVTGLLAWPSVLAALGSGVDVYLFLIGMMLLSELAREEGVFDWLAALASKHAGGSSTRLFLFVYLAGILVTVFMSNDATAVVLTPAVYQVVKRADANPKAYLFACALIANAASFVLPISNPANLVVYASHMPTLSAWLSAFLLASILSILVTYVVLRVWFRKDLASALTNTDATAHGLSKCGKLSFFGLILTAAVLLTCSALGIELGLPTLLSALAVTAVVAISNRCPPTKVASNLSWGVIPLVGGLFVVVEALKSAKVLELSQKFFVEASSFAPMLGKQVSAFAVAIASNIGNNLPVGLLAGTSVQGAEVSEHVRRAVLVGVDLGPNLSVTGSLATVLWLIAIRREGETVNAWDFFRLGLIIMPLSLFAAVAAL